MKEVSKEEVREAVFVINASSSLGTDGMTRLFIQKCWVTVGKQVTTRCKSSSLQGLFQQNGTIYFFVCSLRFMILMEWWIWGLSVSALFCTNYLENFGMAWSLNHVEWINGPRPTISESARVLHRLKGKTGRGSSI